MGRGSGARVVVAVAVAIAGCSAFQDLDGFSGGDGARDGGVAEDALAGDGAPGGALDGDDGGPSGPPRTLVVVVSGAPSNEDGLGAYPPATEDVRIVEVSPTGEPGEWREAPKVPIADELRNRTAAVGDRVYVASSSQTYMARVEGSGLSSWQLAGVQEAGDRPCLVALGDFLYLIGGSTEAPGVATQALYARATTALSWAPSAPMPAIGPATGHRGRSWHACGASGKYVYVAGGKDSEATHLETVLVAEQMADGRLAGWRFTTPLPVGGFGGVLLGDGDRLYRLAGGLDDMEQRAILSAAIEQDGSLGPWEPRGFLPDDVESPAVALRNGRLFAAGGGGGPPAFRGGSIGILDSSGAIAEWKKMPDLPRAMAGAGAVVLPLP